MLPSKQSQGESKEWALYEKKNTGRNILFRWSMRIQYQGHVRTSIHIVLSLYPLLVVGVALSSEIHTFDNVCTSTTGMQAMQPAEAKYHDSLT